MPRKVTTGDLNEKGESWSQVMVPASEGLSLLGDTGVGTGTKSNNEPWII